MEEGREREGEKQGKEIIGEEGKGTMIRKVKDNGGGGEGIIGRRVEKVERKNG